MEKEQYEDIREFAHSLTNKRLQMPDGQLLDLCQQHLDALVAHLAEEFEEHPDDEPEQPETADRLVNALHAESSPLRDEPPEPPPFTPPPAAAEPEVHHPHVIAHKAPHKRPAPRKTHR